MNKLFKNTTTIFRKEKKTIIYGGNKIRNKIKQGERQTKLGREFQIFEAE